MNKFFLWCIGVIPLLAPAIALALCSSNAATVVYVNGIETTQQEAKNDTELLNKTFLRYGGSPGVQILNAYNPTHLDGLGDEIESISQAFNVPISDYDLDTILTQIAPEVTTRRVLLVGHSQGSFYTNEMYDYLVQNGVPRASIGVYDIATPASVVAGGGTYLTSANDKVINYVREMDAQWSAPQALPANIIIPPESGYAGNAWGGHFPEVYLNGAPQRIISDIQNALGELSVSGTDTSNSCFIPPSLGLSYDAQKAAFAVADPAVASIEYAAIDARNTIESVTDNANDILHMTFDDAVFSIIPKPTTQSAAGAFAVEKALYGSSLSVADYEALSNGQNIPDDAPVSPAPKASTTENSATSVQPGEKPAQETPPKPPQMISMPPPPPTQLISISPGFGGGAPLPTISATVPAASANTQQPVLTDQASTTTESPGDISQPAATSTLPFSLTSPADQTTFSTSSVPFTGTTSPQAIVYASFGTTSTSTIAGQNGDWSFDLVLPSGTTTVSLGSADALGDYSATSTLAIGIVPAQVVIPPVYGRSPITDHFDSDDLATWTFLPTFGSTDLYQFDSSTSDCFAGGCIFNDTYNAAPAMYKIGTPLSSGTAVLYFKNQGYLAQISFDICNDSGCGSNQWAGVYATPNPVFSTVWHYWFLAWREGPIDEETCGLTDESDMADCSWTDSGFPKGAYDGIVISQNAGMRLGGSIYFDELGSGPYVPQ